MTTTTNNNTHHEVNALAKRHFNRVVKRPLKMAKRLFPIWAVTYVTKGKLLAPAGSVSIQVLSSQPGHHAKQESLELTCITGEIEHYAGISHFSRVRMSHDFGRNPRAGAGGRVLDPRDSNDPTVRKGDRPNADWVRWGLDADKARLAAVGNNHRLPVVPTMPKIMVGFSHPDMAEFQMTFALKQVIAQHMGRPLEYVETLEPSMVDTLGRAHWGELFIPPHTGMNDTSLYLIDGRFITSYIKATRIYEDYSDLVGVDVWNPARDVAKMGLPREAVFCSVDLNRLTTVLAELSSTAAADADVPADTEGTCPVEAMEDELLARLTDIRQSLGVVAPLFSDGQLLDFAVHPEQEVLCFGKHNLVEVLGEEGTVELLRSVLGQSRPHLLPYVVDSELVAAAKNLAAPLHIARLPRVQVMRRDLRVPLEDALRFGPDQVGCERMYLNFWPGEWSPQAEYVEAYEMPRARSKRKGKKYGASTK